MGTCLSSLFSSETTLKSNHNVLIKSLSHLLTAYSRQERQLNYIPAHCLGHLVGLSLRTSPKRTSAPVSPDDTWECPSGDTRCQPLSSIQSSELLNLNIHNFLTELFFLSSIPELSSCLFTFLCGYAAASCCCRAACCPAAPAECSLLHCAAVSRFHGLTLSS
jgi:hypothetical protein